MEDKLWDSLVQKRAKEIVDSYIKRGVEVQMEHIEQMAAAYLLATDIDPTKVELVEDHLGSHETGYSIRFYFRERDQDEEVQAAIRFLDSLGSIAHGDNLEERIKAVVTHYINQIGRWGA